MSARGVKIGTGWRRSGLVPRSELYTWMEIIDSRLSLLGKRFFCRVRVFYLWELTFCFEKDISNKITSSLKKLKFRM